MTSKTIALPCPFCGSAAREQPNWRAHYGCSDVNCGAHYAALSLEQWNARPAVETTARQLSATDRLHNICDALSEQADESPFTREEWEAVDKQTARINTALRNLIDAVRNVEIEKRSWDIFMALPLQNAYRALKQEDPLNAVEPSCCDGIVRSAGRYHTLGCPSENGT